MNRFRNQLQAQGQDQSWSYVLRAWLGLKHHVAEVAEIIQGDRIEAEESHARTIENICIENGSEG